jgi:sulfoxide reductase heme-binding subunit YedZ
MDRLNAAARRLPVWAVWLAGGVPVLWLAWLVVQGQLGPDPAKTMERELGLWALRFLMASLAITPLRRLGLNLLRFRRALGLLAFAYAVLHLTVWVWPDMGLRWDQMAADVIKRPYLLFGLASALAMLPLALTSNAASIRRMGAAAWTRLHRLAYPALALGLMHFVALSRVWTVELLIYLALGLGLLLLRVVPKGARPRRVVETGR